MKSPARIIEEQERLGLAEPSVSVRYRSRSPSPSSSSGGGGLPPAPSPSGSERHMHRRLSGTPASVKSRVRPSVCKRVHLRLTLQN